MPKNISPKKNILIYIAFIISGVAGLIYESVWSQYLGLFLGHAAYAQTLTLAIFMGGMSIGAWVVSKNISKIKNALFLYVLIEFALGVFGLFFHTIFSNTINFSFEVLFPYINNPIGISILKWFIASLLILPQSILLGSTFPLICSGLIRRIKSSEGKTISILYFTNSLGAAFGALIATFALIPNMGMPGALLVAALLNIFVALLIYIPSKNKEKAYVTTPKSVNRLSTGNVNISYRLLLLVAALTGFASFIYEITWIRMLNLVLGTTLHSFEIMLSAFIFGLAMGSFWIKNKIDNIKNIVKYLGVIQVVMGAMALLTMPLYLESFSWVAEVLQSVLQRSAVGYVFYNILTGTLAIIIMIPAAFCAGMTLPILTNILFNKGENEQAIGKVYAYNTIGALLGVWFAIHIGMTILGLKYMLVFAASVDAMIGLLLIYKATKSQQRKSPSLPVNTFAILYLTLVVIIVINVDFSPRTLSSGTYRTAQSTLSDSVDVLFYKDGKSASISVVSQVKDGQDFRVISTNGKPDAGVMVSDTSYHADESTMVLAGIIPLLLKPEAQNIANIGFGSGMTTHSLLASNKIKNLDTIEIENEIIQGSKYFYKRNFRAYDDPRSNIVIDDAKTFFANKNIKYDIIVSEPSNPWVLGVGNLFSKEFYLNIKRYLKNDGILVQWLQLYEIRPQVASTAINALASEFDYFEAYLSNSTDLIIIASNEKIPGFKYGNIDDLDENIKTELSRIGINNISTIKSRKVGSRQSLAKYFRGYSDALNSDYFPILGLEAPKDRFMRASSVSLFQYDSFNIPAFELIGSQIDFNKIVTNSSSDEYHPYIQAVQKSINFLNYLNDKESVNEEIHISSFGMNSLLKNPTKFCGISKSLEERWLQTYTNIYDTGIILGFESLKEKIRVNGETINECNRLATQPSTGFVITALSLFAEEKYLEYLNHVNSNINKVGLQDSKIMRSLINKALFSIIKTQENEIDKKDYLEIMKANNTLVLDDTARWLFSFL